MPEVDALVEVEPGVWSAGQPQEQHWEALANSGITTVVDLRGPDEDRGHDEPSHARQAGLSYHNLPVDGAAGVTRETAERLDALIAQAPGPVLVHCGSGNRVGALLALRAHANGASPEEALALGERGGLRQLRPYVEGRLDAR